MSGGEAQKKEVPAAAAAPQSSAPPAISLKYADFKWDRICPIWVPIHRRPVFSQSDPATHATQLMIRTPSAIHVRKHWHSANETHTHDRRECCFRL